MIILKIILAALLIYLIAGFLFALAFTTKGVDKVDEGAHGGGWGFRIIIIPGVIVFWPFLLSKWIKVRKKIMEPAKE